MNVEPRVSEVCRRLSQSSDNPVNESPLGLDELSPIVALSAITELLEAIKDSSDQEKKARKSKRSKKISKKPSSSSKPSKADPRKKSKSRRSTLRASKSVEDLNQGVSTFDPPGVKSSDLKVSSKPKKPEKPKRTKSSSTSRTRSSSPKRRSHSPRRKHRPSLKRTSSQDAPQMSWLRTESSITATEKDYIMARKSKRNLKKKASNHGRLSRSMDETGFAFFEVPDEGNVPPLSRKIVPFREIDITSTTTATTKSSDVREHEQAPRILHRSMSVVMQPPHLSTKDLRRNSTAVEFNTVPRRLAKTKLEMIKSPTKRTRRNSSAMQSCEGFATTNSKLVQLETSLHKHKDLFEHDDSESEFVGQNRARNTIEPLDFSDFDAEEFSASEVEYQLSPQHQPRILYSSPRKMSSRKANENKMVQAAKSVGDGCWFPSI